MNKRLVELILVLIVLLLASTVFWFTDADRFVTSLVPRDYVVAAVLPECNLAWPAGNKFPWNVFYHWAPLPALVIAGLSLTVLLAGLFVPRFARWRRQTVFMLLLLALGPGLLVNVLLKEQFGRARPREIVDFGGDHQYTQFWQRGAAGENSSFPSGHAAVAFFVMAPWFVLRDKRLSTALGFLALGLLFGSVVGIARILQGGHFASDVVWAGGLVYLVGGMLAVALRLGQTEERNNADEDILTTAGSIQSELPSSSRDQV